MASLNEVTNGPGTGDPSQVLEETYEANKVPVQETEPDPEVPEDPEGE